LRQTYQKTFSEASGPAGYHITSRASSRGHNETNLDAALLCADRVSKVGFQPALTSIDQTVDNATFTQEVADLSC
jgi:hypothetical protein